MSEPAASDRCPVCAAPNDCGVAAGRSTCWCASETIPDEAVARVPVDARGLACVCRRCASSSGAAVAATRQTVRET